MKATIEQHSLNFAEQGYRSLLVAYRLLRLREYEDWYERYKDATNSFENCEEAISDVAIEIEVDLILAGLTAVEDKLQDGVPTTIAALRCAGIKIWLLTGDKQATALSTAQAASLVNISQTLSSSLPSSNYHFQNGVSSIMINIFFSVIFFVFIE
jgi:magnesium-transporting ATPase (P-type)